MTTLKKLSNLTASIRLSATPTVMYCRDRARPCGQGLGGHALSIARTYGKKLGKATVTGYCIKFKSLKDIDLDTLLQAIQYRLGLEE